MSVPEQPLPPVAAPTPNLLRPALTAGLIVGVLEVVPFFAFLNFACCMPLVACGFLAGYLYRRESDRIDRPFTAGMGAIAGLASGVVAAVVSIGLSFLVRAAKGDVVESLERDIEKASDAFPGGGDMLESLPEGWALVAVVYLSSLLIYSVLFGGFATLGGLLVSTIRSAAPPAAPSPDEPPPPPKVFD